MAMFCLLLAVAAFVLTGGPSLCHCDRPHLSPGSAFYRSDPLAGNGFEESVWNSIGHEPDSTVAHGEVANVIPITKLTLASTVPWQRAVVSARELIVLESLLNRYRKYMVDQFSRYDDACSVLYDDGEAVDSYNDSVEISLGQAVAGRLDDTSGSGGEKSEQSQPEINELLIEF